ALEGQPDPGRPAARHQPQHPAQEDRGARPGLRRGRHRAVTPAARERLRGVYVLADDDPRWRNGVRVQLEGALAGGATVVQLRFKHTPDGAALELLRWAAARAREAGALLFANDRFDLALLSGAHGVHLGQDDLAPEELPAEARARLLV